MVIRMSRIGIIGGSGYIGTNLARSLSDQFNVRVLDLRPPKGIPENVEFTSCDITQYKVLSNSVEDVDVLIHTAIIQIPLINEKKRLAYEVNIIGTQNVCRVVDETQRIKGVILAGSWHVIGEKELKGTIDEEFGFRPEKIEDRARLYALSKICQESITRFYSEMSEKVYGIIRQGTVLGPGMPEKTAANIFIENGLKGKPITPFKHSMYRPMLYVDMDDVYKAFNIFCTKILDGKMSKNINSLDSIFNLYYPKPMTILELAETVRDSIIKATDRKIKPEIEIVDRGIPSAFDEKDHERIKVDVHKALEFLGLNSLISPRESIERIIWDKLSKQ